MGDAATCDAEKVHACAVAARPRQRPSAVDAAGDSKALKTGLGPWGARDD